MEAAVKTVTVVKTAPSEVLRKEFSELAGALGLAGAARDACMAFIMEKTRASWINGKEFGWKKAWAWKRENPTKAAAA